MFHHLCFGRNLASSMKVQGNRRSLLSLVWVANLVPTKDQKVNCVKIITKEIQYLQNKNVETSIVDMNIYNFSAYVQSKLTSIKQLNEYHRHVLIRVVNKIMKYENTF